MLKSVETLQTQAAEIAKVHIVRVVKSGVRRGQNVWDSEWWHGYHDALLDLIDSELCSPRVAERIGQ